MRDTASEPMTASDPRRLRALLEAARRRARRGMRQLRQRLTGASEGLLSDVGDKYLVLLGEKYMHDRRTLEPLIDLIPHRGTMVEVGSLAGFSTRVFARHFDKVISVDPYTAGYDDARDKNSNALRLRLAGDVFTLRFIDDPKVVQYREPSVIAARRFDDRSLDFVYVDGDHTFEGVTADIRAWLPKIRSGGVIAGDDFSWDGVARAVHAELPRFEVVEGRWVFAVT
jgi:predicted O-methyltransferase YrrM